MTELTHGVLCVLLVLLSLLYSSTILHVNCESKEIDIMIDRETPLAEIVGQMSLSKSTDILTQSWVFISVKT